MPSRRVPARMPVPSRITTSARPGPAAVGVAQRLQQRRGVGDRVVGRRPAEPGSPRIAATAPALANDLGAQLGEVHLSRSVRRLPDS